MKLQPEIVDRAMRMSQPARAELARRLLLSLESPDFDVDSERLWADEIERRLEALDRGEVSTKNWRVVIAQIRKSLKKRRADLAIWLV